MLTAAAHGKLKRQLKFWEDEITSCIFGTMQHLPVRMTWEIFGRIAAAAKINKGLFNVILPERFEFEFWPKWATGSGYVEPDLVVHFFKDNQPILHIIVEVKWGAQLSPPCELVRQWRHHLPDDRATWLHLYLVEDSAKGWKEIADSVDFFEDYCPQGCTSCEDKKIKKGLSNGRKFNVSDWKASLGCIGWRHLVNAICDITQDHGEWVEGVSVFFEKQGIVPFIGFEWLQEEKMGSVSPDDEVFFRREPWFCFLNYMVINGDEANIDFFVREE
jgi:hypothetical protein